MLSSISLPILHVRRTNERFSLSFFLLFDRRYGCHMDATGSLLFLSLLIFPKTQHHQLIYSGYSLTQGWFCTPCTSVPSLRGLRNILKVHILKVNSTEWEQLQIPSGVRSIVALNLNNYGSGRNPWGKLKPKYMEKRGFVPAHADDGVLEIFGLKQGWHASFVMVELISAIHIAQAAAIKLEFRGGASKRAYMQMDGEPWKQPINNEYSTFVEIKRTQFQSLMIRG